MPILKKKNPRVKLCQARAEAAWEAAVFELEAMLRHAIEQGEFELYYQGQFDVKEQQKFIGMEALLRNILTPNAAMEGGYRKFRVETKDGELVEGLLVSQDTTAIVLRQPNVPDTRIPQTNVRKAEFTNISVMPEGLLEAMQPAQVSDLFAFLKTLK